MGSKRHHPRERPSTEQTHDRTDGWQARRLNWDDEDVAGSYDAVRFASRRDAAKNANDARIVLRLLQLIPRSDESRPLRLLDGPTGTGRILDQLLAADHEVAGVDLSGPMLGAAARPTSKRWIGFTQGTIEALPYRDNAFDAVISLRFLFHARDLDARRSIFAEFRRVAGFVIGHESCCDTWKDRSRRMRARLGLRGAHRATKSLADLRAELESNGLQLLRVERVSRLFSDKIIFLAAPIRTAR